MRSWKHPGKYRRRTTLRMYLPWWLINRDIPGKGKKDCGNHEWYVSEDIPGPHEDSESGKLLRCYHCIAELKVAPGEDWLSLLDLVPATPPASFGPED